MGKSHLDREQLAVLLGDELRSLLQNWLPEMIKNLPDQLLQTATADDLLLQAKALLLLQKGEVDQELVLSNSQGNRITVVSSENQPGVLARLLQQLPDKKPLARAQIFSSNDNQFIIDVFDFTDEHTRAETEPLPIEVINQYVEGVSKLTQAPAQDVLTFLNAIGSQNRQYSTPLLAEQYLLYRKVKSTDKFAASSIDQQQHCYVSLAKGRSNTRQLLQRVAQFLGRNQIGIHSATCDDIAVDSNEVAMVTLRVDRVLTENDVQELQRFVDLDAEVVRYLMGKSAIKLPSLEAHETLFAVARLIRSRLNVSERFRLSLEEVLRVLERFPQVTASILQQILYRFDRTNSAVAHTFVPQRDTNELTERNVMQSLIDLPEALQKSNLGLRGRQCLAFRIDAKYFEMSEAATTPFGVFYLYGNGFDGFHVRFRDIARGGMRLVKTRNREHYLFESQRLFNEVFDLAWAQNLKNKDIPEGGAKAVVMLKPETEPSYAGRRFVDGLLDLILPKSNLKNYYTADEFLYLGPDENVSPELINWIVENAEMRGYQYFNTFISSKPKLGINHKEFGVTSEGVVVFLTQCLRQQGLDVAHDSFTVKLTGGPDGDVGGNAIRFLIRDFGQRVKIVGISDGSGCAVDPKGLNPTELMRLVNANLPIYQFQRNLLSPEGRLTGVDSFEDQSIRNNMHFRVPADVFLPCGGRPGSINQFNVDMFFDDSGTPISKIIVEGANLFLTAAARERLSSAGVWVIKDSSANKCGVICSSLEIVAGMMLNNEQFLQLKPRYVTQVVERLKELARREAVSLFHEKQRQPKAALPELSIQVSRMILRVSETVEAWQEDWTEKEWLLANRMMLENLPSVLIDAAGEDSIERLPIAYRQQFVSALLASEMVYGEGCRNLELMEEKTLQQIAMQYLQPKAT